MEYVLSMLGKQAFLFMHKGTYFVTVVYCFIFFGMYTFKILWEPKAFLFDIFIIYTSVELAERNVLYKIDRKVSFIDQYSKKKKGIAFGKKSYDISKISVMSKYLLYNSLHIC